MPRLLLLLMLLFASTLAYGQGCSMCRDTTAGSAPQMRRGLRRAIPVLAVPAILLFGGVLIIARRSDRWSERDEQEP